MTAFPPMSPMPNVPGMAPVPKKTRGVKIATVLMILGAVIGGALVFSGVNDLTSGTDSKFYEITPGSAFPGTEDGLRGIYSTSELDTGLGLTSGGKPVEISDNGGTSDATSNFNATVNDNGTKIDVYQKFTFEGKAGAEYMLVGASSVLGARYFIGRGVSTNSLLKIGGGFLLGGLLFLIGLIVLIVSLVRRGRERRAMAAYGMAAPGWSPPAGGMAPSVDPRAPWNVIPGAPDVPPPPPGNLPWESTPPAPPVPPPPPGSEAVSDDPGNDGWAAPEGS